MQTMAEVIEGNHGEILARWADSAKRTASARGLTRPELMNVMPVFLSALARSVRERDEHGLLDLVEAHFSSRLRHGFDLHEIQDEFALLGRCILPVWTRVPQGEQPDVAELDGVLSTLHHASTSLTDMFNRHMFEDAQEEKRFMRLIRQAVSGSMPEEQGGAEQTLRERLHAALVVVMEAMHAATAAVLVYEPASEQLVLSASVGIASEGLVQEAQSLTPSSFVGLSASREEATEVPNVEMTELEVSDALRHSGVQALLGIRLPPQRRLIGVMYIGMREPKTFSPRERRRIEAIGESLALLIENAQLHGALEQQLEEVRAEQKLRDVLVSIIAHDLRGPVGTAKFAAELLGRSKDEQAGPASLQGRTALIIRNLDRADRMVQDLLDAQRLQVGKRLDVARVPCDLSAIVREVVGDLSEQHRDRFLLDAPAEPLEGQWGANELRRAIWNLASNALKYGSPDTPVRIAMRRLPDGAEIAVHNEGRPVPTEDQATLFEPFARARNGHASPQGWGLGLTIVRGVAEAHDGSVEVDSAPGRGTTFTLRVRSA